jgi:hypothetical protein
MQMIVIARDKGWEMEGVQKPKKAVGEQIE